MYGGLWAPKSRGRAGCITIPPNVWRALGETLRAESRLPGFCYFQPGDLSLRDLRLVYYLRNGVAEAVGARLGRAGTRDCVLTGWRVRLGPLGLGRAQAARRSD